MMNAGIITTCIPTSYRFIDSLALGMNNVQIPEELELSSAKKSDRAVSNPSSAAHAQSSSQAKRGIFKVLHGPQPANEREDGLLLSTRSTTGNADDTNKPESVVSSI
ncbi:hypothetical protein BDV23DRAFT_157278 [Aspergillus alliaceus]|uniref:Uncharacterized protein n=1 Tax=Petromyces alliaceus TaxID=209559 RepID=A0A5N7C5B2_PETAA|nr:hypothetical protein BDV23DRAFT_157278 [Aspergillus alliaceus]